MLLTDLKSLKLFLANQYHDDIFFAATFPKDALGLEDIFPYKIVCIDDHPIIDQLTQQNIPIFSLARTSTNPLSRRSTTALLHNKLTKDWINSFKQYEPNILVYKPSPSLEKICQQNRWKLLANPAKLNRQFENKINFAKILTKLHLPQPNYTIQKCHEINYKKITIQFGNEFFLQFPRGFAGSTTFLIKSAQDLLKVQHQSLNYPAKISQKIDGPTYTLNACIVNKTVSKNNIIIQKPFYQITNIPELNPSPGGTCGNIYHNLQATSYKLKSIFEDVTVFGRHIASSGYKGIFGLDFVIDAKTGQHYFIECNPRLTASIPMITKLQTKNNEIPLLAMHIMEFLDLDYQLDSSAIQKISQNPSTGSQIIFRNISAKSQTTPIYYQSGIYTIDQKIKSIHQIKDLVHSQSIQLKYLRPGKDILDIKKENEFLILCEPKEKIISPAIEYLRIQTLYL